MILRIVRNVFGMIGTTALFIVALTQLENGLLQDIVFPVAGISIDNWVNQFINIGLIGLIVALVSSLLWYTIAEWFLKINTSKRNGGRTIWAAIFAMSILAAVVTSLFIPGAKAGYIYSVVIQFANITLSYYLATVLFSPSAFKYTPLLAKYLRRW